MNESRRCPRCGKPMPPDRTVACSSCLLSFSFGNQDAAESEFPQFPEADLKILSMIGQGGMGTVYLATDGQREVVLKVIKGDLVEDPAILKRFEEREFLQARFSHPGIVTVFRCGSSGGHLYIVMEYVRGATLHAKVKAYGTGFMSAEERLDACLSLADAMEYAHEEGILHRDLTSRNVLVDEQNRVKITDFGLAKPLKDTRGSPLSKPGQVLGCQGYMAPEQRNGDPVDEGADIYSLGILFHVLLIGRRPDDMSSRELLDGYSKQHPVLASLLERMVASERSRRPASMTEVKNELRKYRADRHPVGDPPIATEFGKWIDEQVWAKVLLIASLVFVPVGALFGACAPSSLKGPAAVFIALVLVALLHKARRLNVRKVNYEDCGENSAVELFDRLWKVMLGLWTMMYLALAVGWCLRIDGNSPPPLYSVITDSLNNALSLNFLLLYYSLHEDTKGPGFRGCGLPAKGVVWSLVALCSMTLLESYVLLSPESVEFLLNDADATSARRIAATFSGVLATAAMAMFFSRLESKLIFPPRLLKWALYLYAAVQIAWVMFMWDSGPLMLGLWAYGLLCKVLLFLFLYWAIESGRLHFYMHRVAWLQRHVTGWWKEYQERWLSPRPADPQVRRPDP